MKTRVEKLKEVQELTYQDLLYKLNKYGICNVERPTGFGKTELFTRYIKDSGLKCLYIFDRITNKNRMLCNYSLLGEENMCSYGKLFRLNKESFISMISELGIEAIIFDESHTVGATTIVSKWKEFVEYCKGERIKVLGGTATEQRMDGINVTKEFFEGITTYPYDISDAERDGIVLLPAYFTTAISEEGLKELQNEMSSSEYRLIKEAMNLPELLTDCFTTCEVDRNYIKMIVFCSTIEEVINVQIDKWTNVMSTIFPEHELNVIPITSNKEHRDNLCKVNELIERDKAIDIFLSVDMLNQGFHFEDLSGIILDHTTHSSIVFTQQVGRCISVMNENRMFVLDLQGNLDIEYNYPNPLNTLFRGAFDERKGHSWREDEMLKVHMSTKQREIVEVIAKIRNAKQIREAKELSKLVAFYKRFPDKNVLKAGEMIGLNPYATMEYLNSLDILRKEDRLTTMDEYLGYTDAYRLVEKYKQNHFI